MKHLANCRICKKEILLTVDDDYAAMRDPVSLIKMATCKHCFDKYSARERIHDGIYKACCSLLSCTEDSRINGIKIVLETLTKKYAKWLADCHNATPVWQQDFVDLLMRDPANWSRTLKNYRTGYKQALKRNVEGRFEVSTML